MFQPSAVRQAFCVNGLTGKMKNVAAGFSLRQHGLETCATRNPLMDGSIFLVPKLLLGNEIYHCRGAPTCAPCLGADTWVRSYKR
jgi:hypothetical protein